MVKRILIFLYLGIIPYYLVAQNPNGNYNPFVNQGIISPPPCGPWNKTGRVR